MKTYMWILWSLLPWWGYAQTYSNIVQNPSFEELSGLKYFPGSDSMDYVQHICLDPPISNCCHTTCPMWGEIFKCKYWWASIAAQMGSGGVFGFMHSCTNSYSLVCPKATEEIGVPKNALGFQYPHNGVAYTVVETFDTLPPIPWFATYTPKGARGYLTNKLREPTKAQTQYCVTFYVSRTDRCLWASNNIGFAFGYDSLYATPPSFSTTTYVFPDFPYCTAGSPYLNYDSCLYYTRVVLDTLPHYAYPEIITDTSENWVKIQTLWTARGGEKYFMIGNFEPDKNTKRTCLYPQSPLYNYLEACYYYPSTDVEGSGYYVDDVSVVEVHPARAGQQPSYTICPGQSIVLGTDSTEDASYEWYPSTYLSCTTCPTPVANPTSNVTYYLLKKQCQITTQDSVRVIVQQTPEYISIPKEQYQCSSDTFSVKISPPPNVTYSFVPAPYSQSLMPDQWIFYPPYSYAYLFEQSWCSQTKRTDTLNLYIQPCEGLEIPNVFTPNGDDKNDTWHLIWKEPPIEVQAFKVEIYDRWGIKVYESTDPYFKWDGKNCGNPKTRIDTDECPTGTYYYLIEYAIYNKKRRAKGYMTLLR